MTLPEVMVALVIFAMAAVILAASYINILNSYARSERSSGEDPYIAFARQQLLTQPVLATAEAGEQFQSPDVPGVAGRSGTPGESVTWTADIEPTGTTDVFTVTFTCVLSAGGPGGPTTDVETFTLLRPSWSDPTAQMTLKQSIATQIAVLQGRQTQ